MESLRSAAVITYEYEDCDSCRVYLADTYSHTHTRTRILSHTKYVYKCRKRASGRQAEKPVDGVSSQSDPNNEELKRKQN